MFAASSFPNRAPREPRAFTLIELLIVIAIIAILALIAIPNFLEAQIRSKVSRTLQDMRTVATGLEAYHVDNSAYPESLIPYMNPGKTANTWRLTTPVAYITSIPIDIFVPPPGSSALGGPFGIAGKYIHYLNDDLLAGTYWLLFSYGPDMDMEQVNLHYDPTNGTLSDGDIYRAGFGE